jgi:hypothetical protein
MVSASLFYWITDLLKTPVCRRRAPAAPIPSAAAASSGPLVPGHWRRSALKGLLGVALILESVAGHHGAGNRYADEIDVYPFSDWKVYCAMVRAEALAHNPAS